MGEYGENIMKQIRKGDHIYFFSGTKEIAWIKGEHGCTDEIVEVGKGIYHWIRRCLPTDKMVMEVHTAFKAQYTMIPGVNYNGNGWGTFCEYTGDGWHKNGNIWGTERVPWKYGWHRSSIPSMTYSEGNIKGIQISVSLYGNEEDGSYCQLFSQGETQIHRIGWPEEESPKRLCLYRFGEPYYGKMEKRCVFEAWLVLNEKCMKKFGYDKALHTAWIKNDRNRMLPVNRKKVWEYGIAYAKTLYTPYSEWKEVEESKEGFCGFNIGLFWNGESWEKRKTNAFEIGWCGQNAMLANALLSHAHKTGDKEAKWMGFSVLDSWIQYGMLPIGVVSSYYDPDHTRYLECCNLATAGMAYMEASVWAKRLERDPKKYLKTAMEICDFAIRVQRKDGGFAKCWNEDGTVAIEEGTAGAFLILPLIEAWKRTKKQSYWWAAEKAFYRYFDEFQQQGFTTAGALDIFSIDKESAIPLFQAAMSFYSVDKNSKWLDVAVKCAWYLSTWQYSHTCHFQTDCLLGETGYDSFGGTLVSTVHEGIDPFALCYIPELYTLGRVTNDVQWIHRARAIWRNGCQHLSDGSLKIDGKIRPIGSQDESYTVTRQGKRGTASQWLVAWPTSFRLEVLRKMEGNQQFYKEVTD